MPIIPHPLTKFNTKGLIIMNELKQTLTIEEQELMQNPIDRWGQEWRKFMQTHYPEEIYALQENQKWELIPRQIDKEAWEMWELLRKQYAAKNPRPTTFLEIAEWEKKRALIIEHEIMEQIVLQIRG